MARAYNFCAGPASLPEPVLEQARREMMDWQGKGLSVMEMSHRSDEMVGIASEAEKDLRELMGIPNDYAVLFLQGGATAQFSAIPLNLLRGRSSADYVVTGQWSKKALEEGKRYANANVVASSKDTNFSTIPAFDTWKLDPNAAYLHYTPNETIGGVEFFWTPDSGDVPLVADMSSTILSRPVDVTKFGLIYAGAQKNIGPAGLTIVIVRRDLLGKAHAMTPTIMDYQIQADNDSMYNTPPTYAWYLAGLVFKWLKTQGGLAGMEKVNRRKAGKLYDYIDNSGYYKNPVEVASRSLMNIPFTLPREELDKPFLKGAEARGLLNLKGHRSVGGMRASVYNAVPESAVDTLIEYMKDFASQNA
ncbi:MAG: 3-phosphoserine/phosphohydroxythreonine transaminase [Gammaproteobacteria bacterium]|nr:MAG: 3-phosphoserine/phosphohydroxythreonine transaminase [Gammaproteobacteria bacterium]